jgi:Mg/Co/Ni transporter MgtE
VVEIEGSDEEVAHRIEEIPADEGAAVLEGLSPEKAADVAEYLDPDTAGRILTEMSPEAAGAVVSDMEAAEASMVLAAMDPDDAVDVLEHVEAPLHDEIVARWTPRTPPTSALEQYPPDTAGGIMTTEVHGPLRVPARRGRDRRAPPGSTKSWSRCSTSTSSTAAGTSSACCRCAT